MKTKQKKSAKITLSDKIADALTVKPRADVEDDQVFGTKPRTLTKGDFASSESEDEAAISDFRKRNVNLLSEISKKYEGHVVSRKDIQGSESEGYEDSDSEDPSKTLTALNLSVLDEDSVDSDALEDVTIKNEQPKHEEKSISESDESDDYSIIQNVRKQIETSEEEDDQSDEQDSGDEEEEEEGYDISEMPEPLKENFEHVKKQNVSEEAKKGACVRNQLLMWEGLLEMRIHLQRCMNTANQMPLPENREELMKNNEFSEECDAVKTNIATVLDKFLMLQTALLNNNPETKALSKKKGGSESNKETIKEEQDHKEIPSDTDNEEIPSDTEGEDDTAAEEIHKKNNIKTNSASKKRKLEDYEKELSTSYKAFKSYRDSTINKWDEKTRIATASAMKNKNTPTNTVIQRIQYILSDKEKLVKRTQLKRSEFDIIGYTKPTVKEESKEDMNGIETGKIKDRKDDDEYITEIFDDSHFYHQLLRELIEFKSADVFDPVQLTRQWITLQQMRSKMKRKVDTKATKGRKIKYVVHNKLVNYMAPEKCTTWTDESTNELYNSLFGKMFENSNLGHNGNFENGFKLK